jgi:hypothetical protein
MLLLHGYFLDVFIIAILPLISADAGDKSRTALFPWCQGGYAGFGSDKVPNLGPCHRRFIAENIAYAALRGMPAIFVLYDPSVAMCALLMAVASHWIEAVTIAWEIFMYNAPVDSAPPMTLMGIFSTWVLIVCMTNPGDYLTVDETMLFVMKILVGLTWASWAVGVAGIVKKKSDGAAMN